MNEKFVKAYKDLKRKNTRFEKLDDEVVEDSNALYQLAAEVFKEDKLLVGTWSVQIDTRAMRLAPIKLEYSDVLRKYRGYLREHRFDSYIDFTLSGHTKARINLNEGFSITILLLHAHKSILNILKDEYGIVITEYHKADFGMDLKTLVDLHNELIRITGRK